MNNSTKWIFFDFDGTLVDSIEPMYSAYLKFLKKFGVEGRREEFKELSGPSLIEIVSILKKRYNLGEESELFKEYSAIVERTYSLEVKPQEDAELVLKYFKERGKKIMLVTSSPKKLASKVINRLGWEKYFYGYTFGDEVVKSKPSPEIYLLALKKVGARFEEVVAIEDSRSGVISSTSAKIFTIGFENNSIGSNLIEAGANRIINKLNEVVNIIK